MAGHTLCATGCSRCIEAVLPWELRTRNGYRLSVCEVCRAESEIKRHQQAIDRLRAKKDRVLAQRAARQDAIRQARVSAGDPS